MGTSLVLTTLVQWLTIRASPAGGAGLIPGWGTKIPHSVRCGQKNNSKSGEMYPEVPMKEPGVCALTLPVSVLLSFPAQLSIAGASFSE